MGNPSEVSEPVKVVEVFDLPSDLVIDVQAERRNG